MRSTTVLAVVLMAAMSPLAAGVTAPVSMEEATEHPHAGIALAMPEGFRREPLVAPYDVTKAVVLENDQPALAVSLSVFPVAATVTAEDFAEAKMAELKRNLAIRHLKPLKKVPIPVGGIRGTARTMTYTFRGNKTVAAQVYFVRDIKPPSLRLCYLLTVVASAEHQARLLPILGAVIKSVRLMPVQHPAPPTGGQLGEPVADPKLGYLLRRPRGWYAAASDTGAGMGQVDYLLGGTPMPTAQLLITLPTPDAMTSEASAKRYLGEAKRAAIQYKQNCEVVSQGPAKLGDLDGYEFVITQSPKVQPPPSAQSGNSPGSIVIVQRTACYLGGGTERPRVYMLVLTSRGEDIKAAAAAMALIAKGFALIGPTSMPATRPATRPATTAPAEAAKPAVP